MAQTLTTSNNSSPFAHFTPELAEYRLNYIIIQSIIGSVTILSSLFVLALFYCTKHKADGSSRKFFIALTIADLQYGVICSIAFLYVIHDVRINDPYCMELIACVYYTLYVTMFLLFTMTIDRYFSIIYPVKHKFWSTKQVAGLAIIGSWIGGVVMGSGVYFTSLDVAPHPHVLCLVTIERTSDTYTIVAIICAKTPCLMLFLYAYVKMFKVIRQSVSENHHFY